jgi:hypothetical protein
MGLLDDAIREHLEFKRQHGADSEEVARLEHEALGPVDRGGNAAVAGPAGATEATAGQGEGPAGSAEESLHAASEQSLVHVGEETAELDMRTVLAEQPTPRATAPPPEDSLEWEVPSDSEPRGGADDVEGDSGESVEDVLEETPDFLRETPDQDRLWFEQQPPRDFDFDK